MITFKEIYQQLDLEIVLSDLQPVDKGSYFILACPACGKREAYIYKGGGRIRCNRLNKCGYSANLCSYLQMRFHLSRSEAFGKLAELAGMDSANIGRNFETHPYRFRRRRYKVWRLEQGREPAAQPELNKYLAEYQTALTDNSIAALYLNWRRIALEIAREYGLGYSPPKRWHHLKNGKPVRQWRHGHLIFPLENNRGELVNFQARALDSKGIAR